ncbi:MAG: UDP-3-O-(3-hydroxymyristoyl)glucosamine N-acyltransferase [Planctomycetota bacterium]|jgi:UDP-3-O-[3-hydroxymyristoyl] glucosamine N-acyltransferase
MKLTLRGIMEITGGILHGEGDPEIGGFKSLDGAGPGDISFVRGPAFHDRARKSRAGAILCAEPVKGFGGPQVVVPDPQRAMAALMKRTEKELFDRGEGLGKGASVHPEATVGKEVFIGDGAVVEARVEIGDRVVVHGNVTVGRDAVVGEGTILHAGAVVGERVRIGKRCVVGPNSCLGQKGFSVLRTSLGILESLPQVGCVEVGDDVEIGALCTVDRGTMEDTTIGSGTRMDNHCHVAHNVRIGRNCLLVAYARIAGSTVLKEGVTVAEDVGITDNVTIGEGARIGGGSRVYKSVPDGAEVWGAPAKPLAQERRLQAFLKRVPAFREKVRALWRKHGE